MFEPCDRCGFRSYVFVLLENATTVSYCSHHATEYWDGLLKVAYHIDDRRAQARCNCGRCAA